MSLEDAVKRVDEIAQELENTEKPRGKAIIELRKLCGSHLIVPTAYQLEGVVREGPLALKNSHVSELWKGSYKGQEVALKVLKLSQDVSHKLKSRLCKEVALMKQVKHDNILPVYGVSNSFAPDFCLISPWYKNGNIMEYLKENRNANRYDLLLGAVNGLRYLHDARLVHGALQPSHILIDDNGHARLAAAGRSSIVAAPGTSISGHVQSAFAGDDGDFRYMAPEVGWPENYGMNEVLITKGSDVYGMAMVFYEVLTETKPYHGESYNTILSMIEAGKTPERPAEGIDDVTWELLEKCWKRDPAERPSTVELYNTWSNPTHSPQEAHTSSKRLGTGGPPGQLKLRVLDVKFSLDLSKKRQFYVKLRYGNKNYETPPTDPVDGSGAHKWNNQGSWQVEINKQHHEHLVSIEVFRKRGMFRKDKVVATGKLSLSGNANKEIPVKLEALKGTGRVVLKVSLVEV